jgi:hypothetical protein
LRWGEKDTRLSIQPDGDLAPDTEYCISLNLDSRDRFGNSLSKSEDWIFITNNVYKKIIPADIYPSNSDGILFLKWKEVFNADGYEVRIYDKDDVLFSKDIYKATSYEIDESEWDDYSLYAVIPYKKIEGKKAYSKAALETRNRIASDNKAGSSAAANAITYRIEDNGKIRDDQLAVDLGALLSRRSFKKADKTDNPTYRVNLQVSTVINLFVKNGVEMIDIYPTVNIEIFLSANSALVYQCRL